MFRWNLVKMRLVILDRWRKRKKCFVITWRFLPPRNLERKMLLLLWDLWMIFSVKNRTLLVVWRGLVRWGRGLGGGKESYFENVKWNQKCSFKNENFQTLLFFRISTWPQKTNCRAHTDFIFLKSFSSPIFLLWELFLIKNCCKLTIHRRPRRKKKKNFQLTFNTDSYQPKINAHLNFSLFGV